MRHHYTLILSSILTISSFCAAAQTPILIADINPGTVPSDPLAFMPFNGKLVFVAQDNTNGRELWSYTGTGLPTLVNDLYPGTGNGVGTSAKPAAVLNNKLYFIGSNGSGSTPGTTAAELFVYDGVNPPTLAADVNPGLVASSPKAFTVFGGKLYFTANALSTTGTEMYSYDGVNPPVLHEIVPGTAGGFPDNYTEYNGKLYFSAVMPGVGQELAVYDPVLDTITMIADIEVGGTSSYPIGFTVAVGKLWFGALTAANGMELYSYDGSSVVRITDLKPGAGYGLQSVGGSGSTVEIGTLNGKIYFAGTASGTNTQLYQHDPSTGTTSLVATINPSGSSSAKHFTEYKGRLYFQATDGVNGTELWATDGTTTTMVADINSGSNSSRPMSFAVWNGALYMRADNGTTGGELFRLQDATGITSTAFNGNLQLYPNPARELASLELTLPASQMISMGLYDETGKLLWSKSSVSYPAGKTVVEIPIRHLPPSMYFYRLSGADGRVLAAGRLQKQ